MNGWDLVFQQAVAFHGRGQLSEAGSLFAAILEHHPSHFPALQRLAAIRRYQGRLEQSRLLLEQALESYPDSPDAHNSLANTLNALGRSEEAVAHYRRAAQLRPDFPEAHLNLANSLKALGRYEEAAAAYRQAIAQRPDYAEAHTNLGVVLDRLHRLEEALASFSAALHFDGGTRLSFDNVGLALTALNRHEEAISFLQRAHAAEPDAPEPVFYEGITRLAMGDFDRGWRHYEARLRMPGRPVTTTFSQPVWDGGEDISGKTILLHAEQGLGDTLLFARYVQAVVNTGARVLLQVQKPLAGLLRGIGGVVRVLTPDDVTPAFDLHAALGSLPQIFGTIPARMGYLPLPEVPARGGVGVCWAGNPKYSLDYRRSIPLKVFSRLFAIDNVKFISLQKEYRDGDEAILTTAGNVLLNRVESLTETAALIAGLDLIITVDTMMAHLAGALGRPVWILLPFSPYWVWGRKGEQTGWYASARLWRQQEPGNWPGLLDRMCSQLALEKANTPRGIGSAH